MTHMDRAGRLIIDFHDGCLDFRVLVLYGFASTVGTNCRGGAEIAELASKIRWLGARRYATRNVWPRPRRRLLGHDKLGHLSVGLDFDAESRAFSINRTMRGFGDPVCSRLRTSAMFPPLKQYVTDTGLPAEGTIFGRA